MQAVFDIAEICARHEITEAVVCPGSRCAPLTISLARHPHIRVRTVSDERSAAFIAAGIALVTRNPVVLVSTSGTAALNFFPGIAECFYQQIPLLVLTADRPPEWIDQQDGQTIRQERVFDRHVKKSFSFPVDHQHPDPAWYGRRMVSEAINLCKSFPPGPVHINVPLREPFYPEKEIRFTENLQIIRETPGIPSITAGIKNELYKKIKGCGRIMLVPGQHLPERKTLEAVEKFCKASGAVLVADSVSNLFSTPEAVTAQDTILCGAGDHENLQPELLITFGRSVISKSLKIFLRKSSAEHWHIQEAGEAADTFQSLSLVIREQPAAFLSEYPFQTENKVFQQTWKSENKEALSYLSNFFPADRFSEMEAAYLVLESLPEGSILHLGNSMPIRYANLCGISRKVEVYSNRGTSGIDGVLSTALGTALSTDKPVTVLLGDMAFLYDRNAFWNNYLPGNLRIIVLNNHGGGIFRMIEGPARQPELEELFVTRQPLSAQSCANEFSMDYHHCSDRKGLQQVLPEFFSNKKGSRVLEIETDGLVNTDIFQKYKKLIGYRK